MENTGKNRLEINAICIRFVTLCKEKFETHVQKTAFLWGIFTLVYTCKIRAKTVFKINAFCMRLRHFVETRLEKKTVQKTPFLWAIFTFVNACKTLEKPFRNECILLAFWDTLFRQVWKKNCLWAIFTLANVWKTRAKTVLKLRHFACVFLETVLKISCKKLLFLWAIFPLNYVIACKTLAKTILKWMHFACVLRHFLETCLKKTAFLWANFTFVNACKTLEKPFWVESILLAFWDTLFRQVWKKKCLWAIFPLVNVWKTRAKTVLKWKHFACIFWRQFWKKREFFFFAQFSLW